MSEQLCGHWMRNAKTECGRSSGHKGRHYTAEAYERRRAQGRAYDEAYRSSTDRRKSKCEYSRDHTYSLRPGRFARMMSRQRNECAVCADNLSDLPSRQVQIDHDHDCCPGRTSCGKCVRGIVCGRCNTHIWQVENDVPDRRMTDEQRNRVLAYLADPPARRRRRVLIKPT